MYILENRGTAFDLGTYEQIIDIAYESQMSYTKGEKKNNFLNSGWQKPCKLGGYNADLKAGRVPAV